MEVSVAGVRRNEDGEVGLRREDEAVGLGIVVDFAAMAGLGTVVAVARAVVENAAEKAVVGVVRKAAVAAGSPERTRPRGW